MKRYGIRLLALLIVFSLLVPSLEFPFPVYGVQAESFIRIEEGKLYETLIEETLISEELLSQQYIREHLIYEENIYEYRIDEDIIAQAYVYETKVGVNTTSEMVGILPRQIDDYEIDWPAVIGKFAVGTAIIVTVGVVHHFTKGVSSYFIMATPAQVAKDAFIGGAIGAALNVVIHDILNGKTVEAGAIKYAIEGFADGYMWGAIGSVLKVAGKNFKRLKAFKTATGGALKIKLDGTVLDAAGNAIGKAYYDSKNLWHLVDEVAKTTRVFDQAGKELLSMAGAGLPANSALRLGADAAFKLCYTDANGVIFRVGDELLPNMTYVIDGITYMTDKYGRIVSTEFTQLTLKDGARQLIADSRYCIGHGEARTGDDLGHLIADMFNGDNTMANIVLMDGHVNKSPVKAIELSWKKAIQAGKQVSGRIDIAYSGRKFRPTGFTYSYDIGEGLVTKLIANH